MQIENEKAHAWELIGDQFWTIGRVAARPSAREHDLFLNGVGPGDRVCVVGASTKYLIEDAAARGAHVTVLDFSERMCTDLERALDRPDIAVRLVDITQPIAPDLQGAFELVLNDRLINRFATAEAIRACAGMLSLAGHGTVRASVKLGFYDIDLRLIEYGQAEGTLADYYDASDKTFHFVKAGAVLDRALVAHGDIDRDVLLEWYRRRGKETRFDDEDVRRLLASPDLNRDGAVALQAVVPFPDAPKTQLYQFARRA